ncbi:hypothetical protein ADK67_45480 [Saccharothrix sp. NRRL B-16348]|nr:hypothetical protein ADK67_45480 [Saccharothrix sp. NRRL B-16348]
MGETRRAELLHHSGWEAGGVADDEGGQQPGRFGVERGARVPQSGTQVFGDPLPHRCFGHVPRRTANPQHRDRQLASARKGEGAARGDPLAGQEIPPPRGRRQHGDPTTVVQRSAHEHQVDPARPRAETTGAQAVRPVVEFEVDSGGRAPLRRFPQRVVGRTVHLRADPARRHRTRNSHRHRCRSPRAQGQAADHGRDQTDHERGPPRPQQPGQGRRPHRQRGRDQIRTRTHDLTPDVDH